MTLIIKEEIKTIDNFPDYYVSNTGNIYSAKCGHLQKLKPYVDSRGLYLLIKLIDSHGNRKTCLVHRLVAEAFILNPNNFPEVHHKDKNTQNPKIDNLEWCTRKDNLYDSYTTMSSVRNYKSCKLYKNQILIKEFSCIKDACDYAHDVYNIGQTSLQKYLRCGDFYIILDDASRSFANDNKKHVIQNRNPIFLYNNNQFVGIYKSYREIQQYLKDNYGLVVSETALRKYKKHKTFTLTR